MQDRIPAKIGLAFVIGTAVENAQTDGIIKAVGVENVFGNWVNNKKEYIGWGKQGYSYSQTLFKYKNLVQGHPDLILRLKKLGTTLIEQKTMNHTDFELLTAPVKDHEEQIEWYYTLSEYNNIKIDSCFITYTTKSPVKGSSNILKVFKFIPDEDRVRQKKEKLKMIEHNICPCKKCNKKTKRS